MKMTGIKDAWKSEVTIYNTGVGEARSKVYGKSIEFFLSEGVSKTGTNETNYQVFVSKGNKEKFKRNLAAA